MNSSRDIGNRYEKIAQQHLIANKIKILDTNFHSRFGEIDIIGIHNKDTIIFVEVRFRKNELFGSAEESVSHNKQKKIVMTAQYYLQQNNKYQHYGQRYDIIAISGIETPEINWLQNIISIDQ